MATIYVRVPSNELLQAIDVFMHFEYNIHPSNILVSHSRFNTPDEVVLAVDTADNRVTYQSSNTLPTGVPHFGLADFFKLTPEELKVTKPPRFRFVKPHDRVSLSKHPHAVFTIHNSCNISKSFLNYLRVSSICFIYLLNIYYFLN